MDGWVGGWMYVCMYACLYYCIGSASEYGPVLFGYNQL